MKIVVLDGHTLNPGDLSWEGLESLGNSPYMTAHRRSKQLSVLRVRRWCLRTKPNWTVL